MSGLGIWSEARCAQYELSFTLQASRERVWRAWTEQIDAWWLPDFHMLGKDSIVLFEPKAGGRLFERAGERELLWYTILSIDPFESMELAGFCSPKYGGPATTMLGIELTSLSNNQTILRVTDALFGQVDEGLLRSLQSGWQRLFTDGLQRYVEHAAT